jgi:hypothetical protein
MNTETNIHNNAVKSHHGEHTHSKSIYQNQTIRSYPFGPYHSRIMPNTAQRKCRATVKTTRTFQDEINSPPPHNFESKENCVLGNSREANDHEEGLLRPKKGRSRGGEETRKNANNMRKREGKTKEREPGSEAYGRYTV